MIGAAMRCSYLRSVMFGKPISRIGPRTNFLPNSNFSKVSSRNSKASPLRLFSTPYKSKRPHSLISNKSSNLILMTISSLRRKTSLSLPTEFLEPHSEPLSPTLLRETDSSTLTNVAPTSSNALKAGEPPLPSTPSLALVATPLMVTPTLPLPLSNTTETSWLSLSVQHLSSPGMLLVGLFSMTLLPWPPSLLSMELQSKMSSSPLGRIRLRDLTA